MLSLKKKKKLCFFFFEKQTQTHKGKGKGFYHKSTPRFYSKAIVKLYISVLLLHEMILISKVSCTSMLQMILLEGAKATTETVDKLRTGAAL